MRIPEHQLDNLWKHTDHMGSRQKAKKSSMHRTFLCTNSTLKPSALFIGIQLLLPDSSIELHPKSNSGHAQHSHQNIHSPVIHIIVGSAGFGDGSRDPESLLHNKDVDICSQCDSDSPPRVPPQFAPSTNLSTTKTQVMSHSPLQQRAQQTFVLPAPHFRHQSLSPPPVVQAHATSHA